MAAGKFDKLVTIEAETPGEKNSYGEVASSSWDSAGQRWAIIEDASGRELNRARQIDAQITAIITLREQFPGLGVRHRIACGGRVFNISAVLGSSDRTPQRGQIVHCTEVADG